MWNVRYLFASGKPVNGSYVVRRYVSFFWRLCCFSVSAPSTRRCSNADSQSIPTLLHVCHSCFGVGHGAVLEVRSIQCCMDGFGHVDHGCRTTVADACNQPCNWFGQQKALFVVTRLFCSFDAWTHCSCRRSFGLYGSLIFCSYWSKGNGSRSYQTAAVGSSLAIANI